MYATDFKYGFWNNPIRLYRKSFQQALRSRLKGCLTPGYIGDNKVHDVINLRFKRWCDRHDPAKRLYWRIRKK